MQASLENLVFSLGEMVGAERASLFVVDDERAELRLEVARTEEGEPLDVRMPMHKGVAGLACETGDVIRVDDAYACSRFNREVDAASGYRTRSILCVPVHTRGGRVAAVLELLNPIGRRGFSPEDARAARASETELRTLLGACALVS
jgi:adenylate cyclase